MSGEQPAASREQRFALVVDWRQRRTWRVFLGCWLADVLFTLLLAMLFTVLEGNLAPVGKAWKSVLVFVPFVTVQLAVALLLLHKIPLRDAAGRPVPGDALRLSYSFAYALVAVLLWTAGLGVLAIAWFYLAEQILPISEHALIALLTSQACAGHLIFIIPVRLAGRLSPLRASE